MGFLQKASHTEVDLAKQNSRPHEKNHHHEKRREMQRTLHLTFKELPQNREPRKGLFKIAAFKYSKRQRNRIHHTRTGHFGVDL